MLWLVPGQVSEGRIVAALRDEVTAAEVRLEEERAAHTSTQRTAAAREQVSGVSSKSSVDHQSQHECHCASQLTIWLDAALVYRVSQHAPSEVMHISSCSSLRRLAVHASDMNAVCFACLERSYNKLGDRKHSSAVCSHKTACSRHSTSMHVLPGAKPNPSLCNEHAVPPDPLSESRPNVTVPMMACYCSLCKAAWLMEAVHWPACSAWWRSAHSKPPQASRLSCSCSRTMPASLPTRALSKTKWHLGQSCLHLACCVLHDVSCAGTSNDASTCIHAHMCFVSFPVERQQFSQMG